MCRLGVDMLRKLIKVVLLAAVCCSLIGVAQGRRVRSFTSTTDKNGNQRPATADVRPNGSIRCTTAIGQNPNQNAPACYVLGQILAPGQTAGTGGGGTMTLTCNGQAPLRCTVTVTD
jgi:hypothetical protein